MQQGLYNSHLLESISFWGSQMCSMGRNWTRFWKALGGQAGPGVAGESSWMLGLCTQGVGTDPWAVGTVRHKALPTPILSALHPEPSSGPQAWVVAQPGGQDPRGAVQGHHGRHLPGTEAGGFESAKLRGWGKQMESPKGHSRVHSGHKGDCVQEGGG